MEYTSTIYQYLTDSEKDIYSVETIEHIILLYDQCKEYYDQNVFDKVSHVDLYMREGFENYVDFSEIFNYIDNELKKDEIFIENDFLIKIINLIRNYQD